MRFLNLTVYNWGVFRGRHQFNLAPIRQPDGMIRHLTVIRGHNGAGKSTLFQAIALALLGPLALGDRVSQQAYTDFLSSRLHHYAENGMLVTSQEGGVALEFVYVQSGQILRIQVERQWKRSGRNVIETLTVLQNGAPPDVDPADYQIWLSDLVPPGVASLCLFDAERLDALADPQQHNGLLSETLRRLLGLDLVERLQADLEYYILHRGGNHKVERLRKKVLQHQAALDALDAQLDQLRAEAEALATKHADLEAELTRQENRLAAAGGTYAARRHIMQERLAVIQEEVEVITEQLRELSAGLLPFALAPKLCMALSQRLVQEAELHRRQIASEIWHERINRIESALRDDGLWQGLEVPERARKALIERLAHLFREMGTPDTAERHPLVHHLAQPERERLQEWIIQVLYAVPQQVQMLGGRLRELRAEQHRIETDLRRAPDDEILAPIHAEIKRLEAALADVKRRQAALNEQIGALRFRREEQARELQRAADQLAAAQANERRLSLARRSKMVLRAYQDALIHQRLTMLEKALVETFNRICHKEHLLTAVHIDADDFCVQLRSADGHVLDLQDLSAGERQLYALALLWALREVSGRQLPLAMDTPLARLDEVHRRRLVHSYIPSVSEQVILFATDAEMDTELLSRVDAHLARIYSLDYDPQRGETDVAYEEVFVK